MIKKYDIISPPNEAELGKELRKRQLSRTVFKLIVLAEPDELARRRGEVASEVEFYFHPVMVNAEAPAYVLGRLSMDETGDTVAQARIDVAGTSADENENKIELTAHFE